MYRPTFPFDHETERRLGTPRDLCHAISDRRSILVVWVCTASRRVADALGHIYWRIVGSTLADVAESCDVRLPLYRVGRVSFVSFDPSFSTKLSVPVLTEVLRDAVAWYLYLGFGGEPHRSPEEPPDELRVKADEVLPPGPCWQSHRVEVRFDAGRRAAAPQEETSTGDRLFDWLVHSLQADALAGWEPRWPPRIVL